MDTKRLITGTVVGGILISAVGFLLFELILGSFVEAQMLVAQRETPVVWAVTLSALAHGLLLTLAIGWTHSQGAAAGFKTGALVGFLVWLGSDLILYGLMEYATLIGVLTDSAGSIVQYGVAGAAIGLALGMGADSRTAESAPA